MEVKMAIKILIKSHFKEGSTEQAFALIKNFRQDAMNQSGYISGETWTNHLDEFRSHSTKPTIPAFQYSIFPRLLFTA